jgi:predicted metal-dependent phosphoesterase TrpH
VAVWAHPFWDVDDPEEVLSSAERFRAHGLDGVEVFYATHTAEQTLLVHDFCLDRGLLATGSADFHGPDHGRFNSFMAFELHGREPVLGPIGGG